MWTGNVSPVIRQKAKGRRPLRNLIRRANRRKVAQGFPIEKRALSLEEITEYFRGDRLTCLLCGKAYKSLGAHLFAIHAVHEDKYKERYGLPLRKGLVGGETKRKHSMHAKKHNPLGNWKDSIGEDVVKSTLESSWRAKRRKSIFHDNQCIKNVLSKEQFYTRKHFDSFLLLISQEKTPAEISRMTGMPSRAWYRDWMRSNNGDKKRYEDLIHSMPFSYQARARELGDEYKAVVMKERQKGMPFYKIGEITGTTAMTARRAYSCRHE